VDASGPHAAPLFDPLAYLVFAAGRGDVRHVFVDGVHVVRNRELTRGDLRKIVEDVQVMKNRISSTIH
jgi:5-methylthioadenosine/S-adenosylhomocysteine deaminase